MRSIIVLLLACAVSLGSVHAQSTAGDESLFKQKCTTCHTANKAHEGVRRVAAADRAVHIDEFLRTHFCPDAAERKAIVEYLLAESAKP